VSIYQATVRSLTFGSGTDWDWLRIPSGIGPGDYRMDRAVPVADDGLIPMGSDFAGPGVLAFELEIMNRTPVQVEQAARELRAAFKPASGAALLEMTVELASGAYIIRGRPMRPLVDLSQAHLGYAQALVQFETTDPLWYEATVRSVTLVNPSGGGGVTVAAGGVTVAADGVTVASAGTTGDASAVSGTADTHWSAILVGPLETPRLMIGGRSVQIDATIPLGVNLVVDSRKQSVTEGNQPRPWINVTAKWTKIPADDPVTISLRAVSGTGQAIVTWRPAHH
jgi:hypothetical protein